MKDKNQTEPGAIEQQSNPNDVSSKEILGVVQKADNLFKEGQEPSGSSPTIQDAEEMMNSERASRGSSRLTPVAHGFQYGCTESPFNEVRHRIL